MQGDDFEVPGNVDTSLVCAGSSRALMFIKAVGSVKGTLSESASIDPFRATSARVTTAVAIPEERSVDGVNGELTADTGVRAVSSCVSLMVTLGAW